MEECPWLKPVLAGQFEFVEWTSELHLRHRRFPPKRRHMIRTFHFPLMVRKAATSSADSLSIGAFDVILKHQGPKIANPLQGRRSTQLPHFP
jgi:hypothetical protein